MKLPLRVAVRWMLNRVETDYQWYAISGRWNWEPVTRRRQFGAGKPEAGGEEIAVTVDWGQHELVVEGEGAAGASVLFQAR